MLASMSVYHVCAVPKESRKQCLMIRITDSYETPWGCGHLILVSIYEHQVLLSTEPFSQPYI